MDNIKEAIKILDFQINLLISFNKMYMRHAMVCAHSFIRNSKLKLNPVFIIDETITSDDTKYISSIFPKAKYVVVCSEKILKDFPDFQKRSKYHISTLYRIYAIEKIEDRITLYVDADTICRGSLQGLSIYLKSILNKDKLLGACSHFRTGLPYKDCELNSPYLYFNSGVLLFKPKYILEIVNPNSIKDTIEMKPELIEHPDQSPLNYLLKGKVKWMSYIYNTVSWHFIPGIPFYESKNNPLAELLDLSIERSLNEAKIIHYTALKPWEIIKGPKHENEPQNISFWEEARKNFCKDLSKEQLGVFKYLELN